MISEADMERLLWECRVSPNEVMNARAKVIADAPFTSNNLATSVKALRDMADYVEKHPAEMLCINATIVRQTDGVVKVHELAQGDQIAQALAIQSQFSKTVAALGQGVIVFEDTKGMTKH